MFLSSLTKYEHFNEFNGFHGFMNWNLTHGKKTQYGMKYSLKVNIESLKVMVQAGQCKILGFFFGIYNFFKK